MVKNLSRKIVIGILSIALLSMFCGTASAWLTGYDYRMPITVNNGEASELTYYQFNFTADTQALVAAGHMQTDGADCRITDASDNLIPFWNETAFNTTETKIWANATTLAVGDNTFYMYYGNAGASSASDGETTFEFFDDGEGDKEGAPGASLTIGSSVGFSGRCDRVVVADNGDLLMIFRLREDGSYPSGHEGQVWFSKSTDNGETWSTPVKLSNDTYDAINAEFVKYPNGDIEIFYTRYDDGGAGWDVEATLASKSIDNGITWSDFTDKSSQFDGNHTVMWQEHIIGNVVYLAGYGDGYTTFYKTENNGTTWTKISGITEGVEGNWYEPGLVYLGSGEFVCVLRSGTDTCTLQRRSTDWGQTWTTDGYIKSDGSVAAAGVGTDVILHQCQMWNKDKNGNDLGYVYMKTALYPGSFPRDEYAYISTDNCSSWTSRSLLRSSVSTCELAIIFENSSFAKHFSSGNPITNDDLDISEEYFLSENGWTVMGGTYKYDSSKAYDGTMSLYGNSELDRAYHDFTNPAADGSAVLEFDMYDNGGLYGATYFSDQSNTDSIMFGYYNGHSTTYYCIYYGSEYISLQGTVTRSTGWHQFKMEVKPDGYAEFTIDGDKSSTTAPAGELDDAGRVKIRDYDNSETWWDRIRVRKYASTEPTATLGAEETGGGGGAYNITLPAGWNIIGWTSTTTHNAEYMENLIGANCTYSVAKNLTSGLYETHQHGFSLNNFNVERGWGYYVFVTDETIWERDS